MRRIIAIFVSILLFLLVFSLNFGDLSVLRLVYAADSYGNDINYVEVWEDSVLRANFTVSGGSVRVDAHKQIKIVVSIRLNSSLAGSNSEAIDYTKVLVNITDGSNYVWLNRELNNTSCVLSGSYYYLKEEGLLAENSLSEGVTYDVSVKYEVYC